MQQVILLVKTTYSSYNFFPGTQVVPVINNPPAMHTHTEKNEAWVLALGPEEPLVESISPTQVFLPGKSHGYRSVASYHL